ncbi:MULTISPECIES: transposase family protein [unclassified Streptomyces]|uniref:helix-turn-helix domain-containing protein n=1 Tax=unclassified Streptomyces TaxID=2593676 RepID=UPI0033B35CD6
MLVHLRYGATYDVLACWFGADRSTVTRTAVEVRPLLAERECTVNSDVRLRTLAEAVDRLGASGRTGIIGGTEIRVRRPAVGRKETGTGSPPARTGRRSRGRDPCRCRLPRTRSSGRRTRTLTAIQEERPRLVRGGARASEQGTLTRHLVCREHMSDLVKPSPRPTSR